MKIKYSTYLKKTSQVCLQNYSSDSDAQAVIIWLVHPRTPSSKSTYALYSTLIIIFHSLKNKLNLQVSRLFLNLKFWNSIKPKNRENRKAFIKFPAHSLLKPLKTLCRTLKIIRNFRIFIKNFDRGFLISETRDT